jgi:hypothetical protein
VIDLEAAFLRLDADLRALRLRWALLGGFPASLLIQTQTSQSPTLAPCLP